MQIAICEDVQKDDLALSALLNQYAGAYQLDITLTHFPHSDALLANYAPGAYQIIFLDILMAGTNGMEAARRIRQQDGDVTIIFITTSQDFAVDSYQVDAAFYLLKPVDYAALSQALEKCRYLLRQYAKSITVAESRHMVDIRLRDILYLESQRNDCVLHTTHGEIRTRAKLSELEGALGGRPFLRCHRSFVVNLHCLEDMEEKDFLLRGGVRVPISRAYAAAAQQEFRQFLLMQARTP